MLCRRLECTLSELRNMPEFHVQVWEAVLAGEDHGRRSRPK
jgi:hypothetical protein